MQENNKFKTQHHHFDDIMQYLSTIFQSSFSYLLTRFFPKKKNHLHHTGMGLRIFFVSYLCHVDQFNFHISLPSLKFTNFIHLFLLTMTLTLLILAECLSHMNSVKWP